MNKFLSMLAILLPVADSASAATTNGAMTVKAQITSSCVINTSATGGSMGNTTLDFGSLSSLATDANASTAASGNGAVNVLCNKGTAWNLTFDGGANAASGQRQMIGGAAGTDVLPYNLYSDAGYKNKIDTSTVLSGTGTGQVQATQVFGKIPAGTVLPSVGSYVDTVVLTVNY
ncbi:Csu type fimbrial protein [Acinetobacter rathckeae]|uniref:Csu type fimbrial protein n=1 Tax=Acinetobacter rathckeae TaxID=2605272 RepID=UPI0018A2C97B|nr:spore coat U domain-containing protein [Acinetobacter rathckeae]MBF7686711.1 spore coat protein U domain-containing protein [Acinetobacter rathckeae]MBF7695756.1 spore coat protein U domain-containing protein [Acinetobacter rathckeae]